MDKKGSLLLLLVFFSVLLVLPHPLSLAGGSVTVEGVVKEQSTGKPIPHANILVLWRYYRWRYQSRYEKVFHGEADSNGYFVLEFLEEESYLLYAYYDDPLTPGFDYVPSMKSIKTPSSGELNVTFELWDGASMFLDGDAYFVETTGTPQSSYSVLDPESEKVIQFGEYTLKYSESTDSHNYFLGLSPNFIIVPAGIPFMIRVDSVIKVGGKSLTRGFLIDKPNHFLLGKGKAFHVDVREFSLQSSLSTIKAETSEIGLMIDEREEEGFYLAVERQRLAQITSLTRKAENDLSQGDYEASFTKLREAYVEISNLRNWLKNMHIEALISVFLLIPLLAFTAIAASFLLFEETLRKIYGTSAFYALFLPALYLLYPGSRLIGASLFLGASLISLVTILGLAILVPRVLKGREFKGRVPLRNMVVPIFSIAKRSLRRRRLRFALTLTSVMILVSSFITLTSFTTGFGLTFGRVSKLPCTSEGILVRTAETPVMRAVSPLSGGEGVFWFSPMDNSSIGWFEARPETLLVAPKYENTPHRQYRETYNPLGYVVRVPIFGIMGIIPSAEAEILSLNETIVEGRYLNDGDEDSVLISAELKEILNKTVGESLIFLISEKALRLKIVGIFDDKRVESLRDLDGQSPLPMKIIDADRIEMDEGMDIIIEGLIPCSADEVLVTTWRTASEIIGIWLSRLDVLLEGEDLNEYARMMALNKGFRAWASTEEGIYLAQLASYFEGKGLPITIPWLIVVLNVVVTMLNSLYERRRDIYIYSSIGMSPSHISGLFLAEAAIIGVLGGGIGYLLGLGGYRAMSLLTLALQVRQKTSAIWSIAAIAVSMAAVLVGGLSALRGSIVITPSLRRKWSVEEGLTASMEPLELTLPVRVAEAEVEEFVEYVMEKLRSYMEDLDFVTRQLRAGVEETGEASIRRTEFIYRSVTTNIGGIYTKNKLILRKEKENEVYTVKLLTEGTVEGVHKAGSFIRKIIMEWSLERGKLKEKEGLTSAGGAG